MIAVVYLEWQDAVGNAAWKGNRKDCSEWAQRSGHFIREVGFLIEEHRAYLLFAQRWHPEDQESDEDFGAIHKIPTAWIRKKKILLRIKE